MPPPQPDRPAAVSPLEEELEDANAVLAETYHALYADEPELESWQKHNHSWKDLDLL